jgi:ethanolamine-phosphate cytidylyltransferase
MDLEFVRASPGGPLHQITEAIKSMLDQIFYQLKLKPATDLDVAYALIGMTFWLTLLIYYITCGRQHSNSREQLQKDLQRAMKETQNLQNQLDKIEAAEEEEDLRKLEKKKKEGKNIRVFVEGAFDLMHYGHANAFRQARSIGTHLVAGVNSTESIEQCKGAPPVLTDDERCAVVRACKWVDEVIEKTPYVMTPEYLDWVIKKYDIDYVIHGDDPCIGPDGKDVYAHVKARGMFRSIPRTEGVSTTEIVGRMLTMTKSHHLVPDSSDDERHNKKNPHGRRISALPRKSPRRRRENSESSREKKVVIEDSPTKIYSQFPYRKSRFITTSRMIRLFSQPIPAPITPETRVVYITGGWDMFHSGHASILEKAKQLGDYLLVGIHNDGIVNHHRGGTHPVLNLNERVLSVLACKHVDDVVIDPPYVITQEMIAALNITAVVSGTKNEAAKSEEHVFKVPKEMGILKIVESGSDFNMSSLLKRIHINHVRLEKKVKKKMVAEAEHYKEKHGLEDYDTSM